MHAYRLGRRVCATTVFFILGVFRTFGVYGAGNGSLAVRGLPQGGGLLCWNSLEYCLNQNSRCNSTRTPCVVSDSICSSGEAGYVGHRWTCEEDMPYRGLPAGSGILCFETRDACNAGPNACSASAPCEYHSGFCSTGLAGGTRAVGDQYGWICSQDLPQDSFDSGSGTLCYLSNEACLTGPNACAARNIDCQRTSLHCLAGNTWDASLPVPYACPLNFPKKGQPNGFGAWCYEDAAGCMSGPNACGVSYPCEKMPSVCATGSAGNENSLAAAGGAGPAYQYFCGFDLPPLTASNGAGTLCYSGKEFCDDGPNTCGTEYPCIQDFGSCATGEAAGTGFSWLCERTLPFGSMPTGAGNYCYDTQQSCLEGPNVCDEATCVVAPALCSTGVAAGSGGAVGSQSPRAWFCSLDVSPDALPNGAGNLCYADLGSCIHGPNACTLEDPCVSSVPDCQTGIAASQASTHSFICKRNIPAQAQSILSGQFCYGTKSACENGPNICGAEATYRLGAPLDCVVDSTVCGTARSATDLDLTFDWFCPGDSPDGASVNTAGQACYDTRADCVAAPNACSPAGISCDFAPFVCSTGVAAGTPNGYVCPLDTPVGAVYSFSTGLLCFSDLESCLLAPNACNYTSPVSSCTDTRGTTLGNVCPVERRDVLPCCPFVCKADVPRGATASETGLCYKTQRECSLGPNICDAEGTPCIVSEVACLDDSPFACPALSMHKSREWLVNATLDIQAADLPPPSSYRGDYPYYGLQVLLSNQLPVFWPSVSVYALALASAAAGASSAGSGGNGGNNSSGTPAAASSLLRVQVSIAATGAAAAAAVSSGLVEWLRNATTLGPAVAAALGAAPAGANLSVFAAPSVVPPAVSPPPVTWLQLRQQAASDDQDFILLQTDLAVSDGPIVISPGKELTFRGACGAAGDAPCTLDALGASPHFVLSTSAQLTLENFLLVGGACVAPNCTNTLKNGGSIWGGGQTLLVLHNVTILGSRADGGGGAVYSLGYVTAQASAFRSCRARGSAGAVSAAADLTAVDSVFEGNEAGADGGAVSTGGLAVLSGVRFLRNRAGRSGGAVFSGRGLELANVTAIGNAAGEMGGALFINGTALMLDIPGAPSLFEKNSAGGIGGAIFASSLTDMVSVAGLVVRNNSAYVAGGGFYSRSNDTRIANSTFALNVAQGPFSFAGGFAAVTAYGGRAELYNVSFLENSVVVSPDTRKNVFEPDAAYLAATAHGGALFAATLAAAGGPPLTLRLQRSFFRGNRAPFGGVLSAPGSGRVVIDLFGNLFESNKADADGGVGLLGDNVTTNVDGCRFASNAALGNGGVFKLLGNASTFSVTASNFSRNSADLGALVSAGDGHSAALTDCLAEMNTAFGGAVAHVAGSSLSGAALVSLKRLTTRNNTATVSALVFLDVPFDPPPVCEACQHSGDRAAAGDYPYGTLPASYTVSVERQSPARPGGLLPLSVRMTDGFGQRIRGWPNIAFRANAEGTARVGGAVANTTFAEGETQFTLLQVLGGPGDRVELSVQLISPTLPTLSALSATNPAIVSAVIGECLPIEIFSNYTERCICLPGFELVLGTADVFEAYSTSSLCRACPPGSFSGEPGSESCKPCLNNLLSTGTACVECPEGASCEGTNVPLALPDFWRAPESTTAFFNCPEGYCEGEVHALQAEIQGTRAPPPPGGVPPARRHARARQLQQLNGTRPTLPAPAFFVDKNGLLTVDALQYLSQGGDCREGHWGPLCAVCITGYSFQQRVCKQCSSDQYLANWRPGNIAGFAILIIVSCSVVAVFGFLLPILPPLERRVQAFLALEPPGGDASSDGASWPEDDQWEGSPLTVGERFRRAQLRVAVIVRDACRRVDAGTIVVLMKITVDFFQVVADMADSLDVPWPSSFFQFQSRLALLQLDIFSLPFFSCLNPRMDFYTVYDIYIIGITIILASMLLLYFCCAAVARRFGVPEDNIYRFRNTCLARALLVMNVAYIAVSRTVVDMYRCKSTGAAGKFLIRDMRVQCATPRHTRVSRFGIIAVIAFPVGFPLIFICLHLYIRTARVAATRIRCAWLDEILELAWRVGVKQPFTGDVREITPSNISDEHVAALHEAFLPAADDEEDEELLGAEAEEALVAAAAAEAERAALAEAQANSAQNGAASGGAGLGSSGNAERSRRGAPSPSPGNGAPSSPPTAPSPGPGGTHWPGLGLILGLRIFTTSPSSAVRASGKRDGNASTSQRKARASITASRRGHGGRGGHHASHHHHNHRTAGIATRQNGWLPNALHARFQRSLLRQAAGALSTALVDLFRESWHIGSTSQRPEEVKRQEQLSELLRWAQLSGAISIPPQTWVTEEESEALLLEAADKVARTRRERAEQARIAQAAALVAAQAGGSPTGVGKVLSVFKGGFGARDFSASDPVGPNGAPVPVGGATPRHRNTRGRGGSTHSDSPLSPTAPRARGTAYAVRGSKGALAVNVADLGGPAGSHQSGGNDTPGTSRTTPGTAGGGFRGGGRNPFAGGAAASRGELDSPGGRQGSPAAAQRRADAEWAVGDGTETPKHRKGPLVGGSNPDASADHKQPARRGSDTAQPVPHHHHHHQDGENRHYVWSRFSREATGAPPRKTQSGPRMVPLVRDPVNGHGAEGVVAIAEGARLSAAGGTGAEEHAAAAGAAGEPPHGPVAGAAHAVLVDSSAAAVTGAPPPPPVSKSRVANIIDIELAALADDERERDPSGDGAEGWCPTVPPKGRGLSGMNRTHRMSFAARMEIEMEEKRALEVLGSMLMDYKIRKLLLTGILSAITHGSVKQVAAGTLLSFIFVVVYMRALPFAKADVNVVAVLFHITLFFFFFVGLLLKVKIDFTQEISDNIVLSLFIASFGIPFLPVFFEFKHSA